MKKLFMIIAAMVFLTFISSNTFFAGDEADSFRAAVQSIFNTYSAANVAGDTASYMALCDENIIKMGPNRPALFGKAALEESSVLPVGVLMQKKLSGGALARWSDGHVIIRIRPAVIVPAHPEILNRLPSLVRL